jgi:hypothetical protein
MASAAKLASAEQFLTDLDEKADMVRLRHAHALIVAGRLEEAKKHQHRLADPAASPVVRFNALLLKEQIGTRQLIRDGASDRDRLDLPLSIAMEMRQQFRKGPKHLKLFALIMRKAAEFDAAVHQDHNVGVVWAQVQEGGDPLLAAHLAVSRAISVRQVNRCYRQCLRLLHYARSTSYRGFLTRALVRIAQPLGVLLLRLRREGFDDQAKQFAAAALQICQLCALLAAEVGDENQIAMAAHTALIIDLEPDTPAGKWAREVFAGLKDDEIRNDAEGLLRRAERRRRGEHFDGDIPTTPRQIFENMAAGLGVDLRNPNDSISTIIRIGLADLDPSRVLRDCENLHVEPDAVGLPGLWLGLHSAGSKIIHCERHDYAMGGLVLDRIYSGFLGFRQTHCLNCPDRCPRSAEWTWSPEFQETAQQRHAERIRGRHEGV